MAQLFFSALHKSSGKTAVSVGVAAALAGQGLRVQTFKKGPDYIDPGWLSQATKRPCYNLDFHTMHWAELLDTMVEQGRNADFCLIEGTKGLHDGVDPGGRDSNAALAQLLGAPVVLVVDCRGLSRGIAPLLLGQAAFDPRLPIAGVILNRLGGARHEAKLRAAVERYTDIPVLGALGENPDLHIQDPYLGLVPANEQHDAAAAIARLAAAAAQGVDLPALIGAAAPLPARPLGRDANPRPGHRHRIRIAVARDRAFGFYYPGDLQALEDAGAELHFFDALRDTRLPAMDGLFLGGGFPERHAAELSANHALRDAIATAAAAGLPIYAECGGLMYLARSLHAQDGRRHAMAGVLPVDVVMERRPQGRGYVRLAPTGAAPWSPLADPSCDIPAHEFHYSRLVEPAPQLPCAYQVLRGAGLGDGRDGLIVGNTLASYAHLRHTRATPWATRFVEFAASLARPAGGGELAAGAAD